MSKGSSGSKRLSICYVVPGHDLFSTVGPSRNVLNLAAALSALGRRDRGVPPCRGPRAARGFASLEIQPGDAAAATGRCRDERHRLRRLPAFPARPAPLRAHRARGVSTWCWRRAGCSPATSRRCAAPRTTWLCRREHRRESAHAARRQIMKLVRLRAGRWLASRALRGAPLIIAETEFLKKEIAAYWRCCRSESRSSISVSTGSCSGRWIRMPCATVSASRAPRPC